MDQHGTVVSSVFIAMTLKLTQEELYLISHISPTPLKNKSWDWRWTQIQKPLKDFDPIVVRFSQLPQLSKMPTTFFFAALARASFSFNLLHASILYFSQINRTAWLFSCLNFGHTTVEVVGWKVDTKYTGWVVTFYIFWINSLEFLLILWRFPIKFKQST